MRTVLPRLAALASHSSPAEFVHARRRPYAKYGALLVLTLVPALALARPAAALHNTAYGGTVYPMVRGPHSYHFVLVAANSEGPPIPRFAPLTFSHVKAPHKPKPMAVGKVRNVVGTVTVTRNGVTKPLVVGDRLRVGDTFTTGSDGAVSLVVNKNTILAFGENAKMTLTRHNLNPAYGSTVWTWLQGAFAWTSGLIKDNNTQIDGPVDSLGIRGTRFIASYDAKTHTEDIALSSGSVAVTPKRSGAGRKFVATFKAPVLIHSTATSVTGSPLTRAKFQAMKAALFLRARK